MDDNESIDQSRSQILKYRESGLSNAARIVTGRHLKDHPDDLWAWLIYASMLIDAGRMEDAETILQTHEPVCGDDFRFVYLTTRIEYHNLRGNNVETEYWCNKMISEFPDDSSGFIRLGICLVCQGKLSAAEKLFRQGTTKPGAPDEAWLNLSSVLAALNRFGEAKTALEKALEIDPGYSSARQRNADLQECLNLVGENHITR